MTTAATTGLTALPENLRAVSMQTGNVLAELGSGADTLVLNVSSDSYKGYAQFTVHVNGQQVGGVFTAGVEHGVDTESLVVRGDWGAHPQVTVTFLNDLWEGTAETDRNLYIDGASYNGEEIADAAQVIWADFGVTLTGGSAPGSNDTSAPAPTPGSDVEFGTGADTLVLNVSGESYKGDAQFIVQVNGKQVGGVFTATAQHGADTDTLTLHGDWGVRPEVTVTFVNDLWEGTAATDRNLHIDSASYNGEAIAAAPQTVWGNYGVTFTGGSASSGGSTTPEAPAQSGDVEFGTGADTLVLDVSGDSYKGDAQFTVQVNGKQVGGVFSATADHGADSDAITLHGDWGANAKVTVTFLNDLWEGSADTDRNLYIDGATYNGKAIDGAAQVIWADFGVSFSTGAGGSTTPPVTGGGETEAPATGGGGTETPSTGGGAPSTGGGSAPAGYTLVLADDFSNGYLYENWGSPFHGGTYWNGAFSWDAGDVGVRNGEMQVTMTNHGGWWTAGGFSSFKAGNTITYGKVEFDAKVPDYQGTMTAILTWPASDVWPKDGEIDILETPHNENMFSTHYEGPDGSHWYDSIRSSSFDASQWNHYEMTWLPDRLTIAVNGQVMAEWTDPALIPDVAHGFGAMGFVGSPIDQWMGGAPDGSTPNQVTVSLDNVRMYQLDGIL